jgi:hypothetical protein
MTAVSCGFTVFLSRPAAAAPFCIEAKGVPAECWYYDVRECKTAAAKEHARCSVNPKEITVSGTGGSYCIVDSGKRPTCSFQNWGSCEDAAAKQSGSICFENSKKQSDDPFRYDRMPLQPK